MKNLFFGLAILGVAISASAFTNAKTDSKFNETYYVTGHATISTTNDAYAFDQDEVNCPGTGSLVCKFTTGSTLASPQLKTTVESQSNIERRDSF